ncbi:transcriptional regulator [Nocardia bovistercoris]|uniref:Transcriptional regulator n=1 Tax=Nocardia bovistercoris TaxID=2785916 RepID=A0A931N4T9_9NOCA|nr:transcriptional regulator [Nocardia bovistercoris]MBH0779194.1 transcriptional regulator [Nocardia bovistercoris]
MVGIEIGSDTTTLTSRLVDHLAYRPRGAAPGDLTTVTRHCLAAAVRSSLGPSAPPGAQPSEIAGSAARWAREGVALETVLGAYHDGIRAGLEFLATAAENNDSEQVVAGARLIVRALEMVTLAASTAYVEEHRVVAKEHQTAAQTLVSALLAGHGVGRMARQTGITVAPVYQVIALSIPPHPDESRPGAGLSAARYKLRRVQAALAYPLGSRALSLLSSGGGTVLVPIDDEAGALTPLAMTSEVLELVSAAAEVPLIATMVAGRTKHIPELAARAHEFLHRLRVEGRAPGLYAVPEPEELPAPEVEPAPRRDRARR